jgi:hypothetical protein
MTRQPPEGWRKFAAFVLAEIGLIVLVMFGGLSPDLAGQLMVGALAGYLAGNLGEHGLKRKRGEPDGMAR